MADPTETIEQQKLRSKDTNILLDKLQSTVEDISPFSLGENALAWVYFVAAGNSTQTPHRAFFTSRLGELLERLGHDDTSAVAAGTNIAY